MDIKEFSLLSTLERKKVFFKYAYKANAITNGFYDETANPKGKDENTKIFLKLRDYLEYPLSQRVPKKWFKDFE